MNKAVSITKEKVAEAAANLFNNNGYSGTSVRDIAEKAGVNVSLISYYFGGKKGLLEFLMSSFLEGYLYVLEDAYKKLEKNSARSCLIKLIEEVIIYQQGRSQAARLVHREISIDTTLVREIMTTYLMKEKYYFNAILDKGVKQKEFNPMSKNMVTLQLRSMLFMPFLYPQYIKEVYQFSVNDRYFTSKYLSTIQDWVNDSLCINYDGKSLSGKENTEAPLAAP
ncbi:forespore capture DNA-binding protein RefZ [Pseudalkalibacillus berkeleyi]|uniref:Forespore capture DNA-binding protein RefZ n=1 Tax=Pseudalkalibacillus berkeleyi TaxID=1069813 RepID=A0ABS9H2P5_9BACL|nr:forespore capture DNA-binding protein RefZ [Pseudalkalibacillus berkeleyi]MCF6138240.1 forespore capture DNA-binding protein RefZ [Pseudalkalibacillus berkeleyi]